MKRILTILTCSFLAASASMAQDGKEYKAYMVSNAHFDSQWNWDVQKSISEYIPKTMDRNLFLLEKYPGYIFNFEGGVKYSWMKEYFPEKYEMVKEYIKAGRWHVTGSTWDATDVNVPSPESLTRNILYGQHFYRDEFGVEGTDIFLPDCFGFGWTLPTVAAHSGLIGFSTQKLQWRNRPFYGDSKIPFEIGLWEGIDGSRIMLVADAHNYTTKLRYEDLSHSRRLIGLAKDNGVNAVYHYYGTGDTGGSPTIESVRTVEHSLAGDGPVEIISAESDRLYKDYLPYENHPELPVWDGELLMDVHATGCYTSQAAMKLYNRRNEQIADAAERSAVAADWLGTADYPQEFLNEAWKRFIWHQFHDDLTGTSIPRAYEFSWNDELISMKQFSDVLTSSVGAVSREMDTDVKGMPLVVYNAAGFRVDDIVEASLPYLGRKVSVYDGAGRPVACQVLSSDEATGTRILFNASVPAAGYAVYDVRKGGRKAAASVSASGNVIENSVYKVTLDGNGDICSIMDKRDGRELVEKGKAVRLALFTHNPSYNWPAWEIIKSTMDAEPVPVSDNVEVTVAEAGPVRGALRVERTHGDSRFVQYVTLYEGGQSDRIDIRNEIDWQTTDALLKAEFPLSVSNPEAVYDLGVGSMARGNNTDIAYEVYAQQWADLTEEDGAYGVSVLNDSKYGWDKPSDNTLRLTLLHTPSTQGRYTYQSRQDFGHHIFTYSIVGHAGDFRTAGTVRKAEVLNQPLKAFSVGKHRGALGRTFSFAESLDGNVALRALKHAEDTDAYVVRFYETAGSGATDAKVRFASDIIMAKELNGNEDVKGNASFSGNELAFSISPYGMKTFMVKLKDYGKETSAVESVPVVLPYNAKAASYNAFRSDVNFDGKGNSFAAELLPEEIMYRGVRFVLQDGTVENAVKCNGDTVALPAGDYNRLYLLAASTLRDTESSFKVGDTVYETVVPYYSGFVGQWGHTGHTEAFLKSAGVAYVGTHRHSMIKNADLPYEFAYMFCIGLDIPEGATELVLPDDPDIVIFAASAADDKNNVVTPASDLLRVCLPEPEASASIGSRDNLLAGKPVVECTGQTGEGERAELATDGNPETKWCDVSGAKPKYITVDLGKDTGIKGWYVMTAGLESLDYIAKEYSLQVKADGQSEWKTVDTVYDNTDLETDRLLAEPVAARYVRLSVSKPDQSEGAAARIYEFKVY